MQEADTKPVSPKADIAWDQDEEGLRALRLGMPTAEVAGDGRLTPVSLWLPG